MKLKWTIEWSEYCKEVDCEQQKGVYEMEKNKMQRLEELEKEFREVGYTEDAIKAIEKVDGAIEIADFINNLESEKSYWGE